MRTEIRTRSADDTRAVGEVLASLLVARDVVALSGDLGAGKTTFVQGVARGLGIRDQVVSPTFMLVREYQGRLDVLHVDVYRLNRVQEVVDLGLEDLFGGKAVALVEWGDAIEALLPRERLDVEITMSDPSGEDEERRLLLEGREGWGSRWERLESALAPWGAAA